MNNRTFEDGLGAGLCMAFGLSLFAFTVFMSIINTHITDDYIDKANEYCSKNGNVASIEWNFSKLNTVNCNNGASFRIILKDNR